MAEANIPEVIDILNVESRSVLNYVVTGARPSIIDDYDKKAEEIFAAAWKVEAKLIDKLVAIAATADRTIVFDGIYPFVSARLAYAQAHHIAGVMPKMIESEIAELKKIRAKMTAGTKSASTVDQLIAAKTAAVAEIVEAHAEGAAAKSAKSSGAAAPAAKAGKPGKGASAEFPWKSADMPLNERLAAARGRAIADQLWAAMAQTDCTACGYDCEGYAKAIASGEEKDITKCVPGEAETADALKKILATAPK